MTNSVAVVGGEEDMAHVFFQSLITQLFKTASQTPAAFDQHPCAFVGKPP